MSEHFADCTQDIRDQYGCICEAMGETRALVYWAEKKRKGEKIGWIARLSLWWFGI